MLPILYSIATHSIVKFPTIKVNKWAWGTFDISTSIQLMAHTLVINTTGERAQHISVITVITSIFKELFNFFT